jgi:hypothetical protein
MGKLTQIISIELTRIEWREVVDALENSSTQRYQDADLTNNQIHRNAWLREADWHERLAGEVRDMLNTTPSDAKTERAIERRHANIAAADQAKRYAQYVERITKGDA